MPEFIIIPADCLGVMPQLPENSVDSIITDPPYGLEFMGKSWDHGVPGVEFWKEALRVAKPGAYLLAFGGTRTFHRLAVAIEDAGWEMRDTLMWVYGKGFPKSTNVARFVPDREGWGTALKPAWEPIIMARKPLVGTIAANVTQYGTGGINVDACRVPTMDKLGGGRLAGPTDMSQTCGGPEWDRPWMHDESKREFYAEQFRQKVAKAEDLGRWPANLVHDGSDEVLSQFPGEGEKSAARFFYCTKASVADRDEGLDEMPVVASHELTERKEGSAGITAYAGARTPRKNTHPTVKPTDLMRWCCRLVTPPGGLVFDPFAGSCSTGKAALLEGFDALMIEQDDKYVAIGQARMEAAVKQQPVQQEQSDDPQTDVPSL